MSEQGTEPNDPEAQGIDLHLDEFRNRQAVHSTGFRDFYVARMASHPEEYSEAQSLAEWYEEFNAWLEQGMEDGTIT
jgi:hypothetical protein